MKGLFTIPEDPKEPPRLIAGKCRTCDHVVFPSKIMCVKCHSEDMEEVLLEGKGRVYTFTICRMPVPHIKPPYAIGHVVLDSGERVFAHFKDWQGGKLKIGARVEMDIGTLRQSEDGGEVVSYVFRPIVDG